MARLANKQFIEVCNLRWHETTAITSVLPNRLNAIDTPNKTWRTSVVANGIFIFAVSLTIYHQTSNKQDIPSCGCFLNYSPPDSFFHVPITVLSTYLKKNLLNWLVPCYHIENISIKQKHGKWKYLIKLKHTLPNSKVVKSWQRLLQPGGVLNIIYYLITDVHHTFKK